MKRAHRLTSPHISSCIRSVEGASVNELLADATGRLTYKALIDGNHREIGYLSKTIDEGVQRVIETQTATLAGMAAKAELLLLLESDDELAASIANDLLRHRLGAKPPTD